MLTILAHAEHTRAITSTETVSAIDHCMPVIIGASIIIAILAAAIVYFLLAWQPKKATPAAKSKSQKK